MDLINLSIFGFQFSLDGASFIVVLSMLASFITIVMLVLPFIKRREQKELVKAAIKDERKKVFQQML